MKGLGKNKTYVRYVVVIQQMLKIYSAKSRLQTPVCMSFHFTLHELITVSTTVLKQIIIALDGAALKNCGVRKKILSLHKGYPSVSYA